MASIKNVKEYIKNECLYMSAQQIKLLFDVLSLNANYDQQIKELCPCMFIVLMKENFSYSQISLLNYLVNYHQCRLCGDCENSIEKMLITNRQEYNNNNEEALVRLNYLLACGMKPTIKTISSFLRHCHVNVDIFCKLVNLGCPIPDDAAYIALLRGFYDILKYLSEKDDYLVPKEVQQKMFDHCNRPTQIKIFLQDGGKVTSRDYQSAIDECNIFELSYLHSISCPIPNPVLIGNSEYINSEVIRFLLLERVLTPGKDLNQIRDMRLYRYLGKKDRIEYQSYFSRIIITRDGVSKIARKGNLSYQ